MQIVFENGGDRLEYQELKEAFDNYYHYSQIINDKKNADIDALDELKRSNSLVDDFINSLHGCEKIIAIKYTRHGISYTAMQAHVHCAPSTAYSKIKEAMIEYIKK